MVTPAGVLALRQPQRRHGGDRGAARTPHLNPRRLLLTAPRRSPSAADLISPPVSWGARAFLLLGDQPPLKTTPAGASPFPPASSKTAISEAIKFLAAAPADLARDAPKELIFVLAGEAGVMQLD